jgi:hypothetical protein
VFFALKYKIQRCSKLQQVQSVECSNVGKLTRAALIVERMKQCAALMIERTALKSVGGAGLLWSVTTFEHSPDCTYCNFGHLRFIVVVFRFPIVLENLEKFHNLLQRGQKRPVASLGSYKT